MPALGAEVSAVQLPMLRYAKEIGWALVFQTLLHHLMTGRVRVKEPNLAGLERADVAGGVHQIRAERTGA